ncbi:MAG: glycosyltransferase [Pyrinomonadaceae bacterium]|nr:glycosyltransferase [Pyrinomonadaceae bacterium]
MKIVRIIARLNVGGPARHVIWLTAALQDTEYESLLVTGVVPPNEDDMSYFAEELRVKPLVIPEMSREISPKDALTVWKLYRLLLRERPDLVHTHTAKAGTVGRLAGFMYRWLTPATLLGRPRRCRFVHTYHGHIFHSYYGPLKTRLFIFIEKMLARLSTDRIVVISQQQFREIHERFGVGRREQFSVIRLGFDLTEFDGWESRRDILRRELGTESRDVLVGIVGRLTGIKNHSLFLEAVARFKEQHGVLPKGGGRVRFLIIGDGQLRQTLEDKTRSLGLEGDVLFLGTRNDPENFYPALDVVALTSHNEGTPLTLIEAMGCARPFVATVVGGVVDLLGEKDLDESDGVGFQVCEHGVSVRPDDAESFSGALEYIIRDEQKRLEMGRRGRRFVEENYSIERLLSDIRNLYRGLEKEQSGESWESGESRESTRSSL